MEPIGQFKLHASHLGSWTRCEWQELWNVMGERPPARSKAEHVAAYIGRAVHAWVAGADLPAEPEHLRFDKKTPTINEARATIQRMGSELTVWVRNWGWEIVEHERWREGPIEGAPDWLIATGTLDLEVRIGPERGIPDIKTGAGLQGAWLQIGTYSILHPHEVDFGAVIHFPRVPLAEELMPPTVERRPAKPLEDAARGVIRRVGVLLSRPEAAVPSPGGWCEYCDHPSCPVRAAASREGATEDE